MTTDMRCNAGFGCGHIAHESYGCSNHECGCDVMWSYAQCDIVLLCDAVIDAHTSCNAWTEVHDDYATIMHESHCLTPAQSID